MKRKRTGFTVVEILTVVTIIAILLGVLIPALSMVRNFAKETKQKAQIAGIELALLAFRNDYGDYPPSDNNLLTSPNYCGAQKLAEALLGWDLMGFHPKSAWRADGYDGPVLGPWTYDPDPKTRDNNGDGFWDTFDEREGPYLELATANAYQLGTTIGPPTRYGLYDIPDRLASDTYVLCDSFSVKNITITTGPGGKTVILKAGTPILYYRANTSSKYEVGVGFWDLQVYNMRDNTPLVEALPSIKDDTVNHPLGDSTNNYETWCNTIIDPQVKAATGRDWPYNPDSYILISAGMDGLYGTEDDITNFGK